MYQIHLLFAHSPGAAGSFRNPDKTVCTLAASHNHRHHILLTVVAALVVDHHKNYLNFRNLGYIKLIFNL